MSLNKKTSLIKQACSGYSKNGKKLSGVLNVFADGDKVTLEAVFLSLTDLTDGEYFFKYVTDAFCSGKSLGKSVYSVKAEFNASCGEEIKLCGDFILFCKRNGLVKAVAFSDGRKRFTPEYYENLFSRQNAEEKRNAQSVETEISENVDDVNKVVGAETYDDEKLAEENYYEYETSSGFDGGNDDGNESDDIKNVAFKTADESETQETRDANSLDEDERSGYFGEDGFENGKFYESVKDDIESAFDLYEKDEYLSAVIPESNFVKVVGEREFSFGIVKSGDKIKYVCYGVKGEYAKTPPEKLKGIASFVPKSIYDDTGDGYWVIFQDAETGECIKTDE